MTFEVAGSMTLEKVRTTAPGAIPREVPGGGSADRSSACASAGWGPNIHPVAAKHTVATKPTRRRRRTREFEVTDRSCIGARRTAVSVSVARDSSRGGEARNEGFARPQGHTAPYGAGR